MTTRQIVIFGAGAAIAAAGTGWWRAHAKRETVRAGLPREVATQVWPEELRARIAKARAGAEKLVGATAALGELSRLYHANGFSREAMQCYAALEKLAPGEPRWAHRHATRRSRTSVRCYPPRDTTCC